MNIIKMIASGGYVVLRKGSDFRAYWANPYDDEFEMNEGGDVSEAEVLRTHGKTTRFQFLPELNDSLLETMLSGWVVWRIYVYHKNLQDVPEEFSAVHRLIPHGLNYKALETNGDLLCIIPESSAMYLFSACGVRIEIPYEN